MLSLDSEGVAHSAGVRHSKHSATLSGADSRTRGHPKGRASVAATVLPFSASRRVAGMNVRVAATAVCAASAFAFAASPAAADSGSGTYVAQGRTYYFVLTNTGTTALQSFYLVGAARCHVHRRHDLGRGRCPLRRPANRTGRRTRSSAGRRCRPASRLRMERGRSRQRWLRPSRAARCSSSTSARPARSRSHGWPT